jgi:hypothetical protein
MAHSTLCPRMGQPGVTAKGGAVKKMFEREVISSLGEADIDLLLVEELHVSSEFASWFVDRIADRELAFGALVGAWRSVSTHRGETDVLLIFQNTTAASVVALLIENKIRAEFQDRQPERYYERGEDGLREGLWDEYRTVLIAPQGYLDGAKLAKFDHRLSYELIRSWFDERSSDPRHAFKAKILGRALDARVHVWQRHPDEETTEFFQGYEEVCNREFPALGLRPKPERSASDHWVYFRWASGLPKTVYIIHKCDRGFVDLTFPSHTPSELEARLAGELEPDMAVIQTGKSSSVRLVVGSLDHQEPFDVQADDALAGIEAAERLRAFAERLPT